MSEPISIDEVNRLQEENKELREQLDRAESGEKNEMDIANEYKKALEEIREIFKKQLPTEVIQGRFPMIYYSEYFNREKQILNKISEVLK